MTGGFSCGVCEKKFRSRYKLGIHLAVHTGSKPYQCDICLRCFQQKHNLVTHLSRLHDGHKPFTCHECGKSFGYTSHFKAHVKTHFLAQLDVSEEVKDAVLRPHHCDKCDRRFETSRQLEEHCRVHTKEKPFCCNSCQKCFSTRRAIVQHVNGKCSAEGQKKGRSKDPTPCEICGKEVARYSMTKHLNIHTRTRIYKCRTCGKDFLEAGQRSVHERIHSGSKPHRCEMCGKGYAQHGNLIVHKRRYHNTTSESQDPNDDVASTSIEDINNAQYSSIILQQPTEHQDGFYRATAAVVTGDTTLTQNSKKDEFSQAAGFGGIDMLQNAAGFKENHDHDTEIATDKHHQVEYTCLGTTLFHVESEIGAQSSVEQTSTDVESEHSNAGSTQCEQCQDEEEANHSMISSPLEPEQPFNASLSLIGKEDASQLPIHADTLDAVVQSDSDLEPGGPILADSEAIELVIAIQSTEPFQTQEVAVVEQLVLPVLTNLEAPPPSTQCTGSETITDFLNIADQWIAARMEECRGTQTDEINESQRSDLEEVGGEVITETRSLGVDDSEVTPKKELWNKIMSEIQENDFVKKALKTTCLKKGKGDGLIRLLRTLGNNLPKNSVVRRDKEGIISWQCWDCSVSLSSRHLLLRHRLVHTAAHLRPHQCSFCNRTFTQAGNLQHHLLVHKKEFRFTCGACGAKFRHRSHYSTHVRRHESGPTTSSKYSCDYCGKGCSTKFHLEEHVRTHTKELPFLCKSCGAQFAANSSYTRHVRQHDSTKEKCSECGKDFTDSSSRRRHEATHRVRIKCVCACGRKFTQQSSLRRHLLICPQADNSAAKKFICPACNKSFINSDGLKRHAATHDPTRRFACPYCDLTLKTKETLNRHLTRHKQLSTEDI